ncbi:disintegrin and metalloproteinase domain-containing protein 9-like isoform X2 [Rhinoraja longicauda]
MCGKLQCENVNSVLVFGRQPSMSRTPIDGTVCWGVDFELGSDVPDPGMVSPGTRCDPGKVCMDFTCVDVSVLNYDCDVEVKCSGHGVCNNNKNCHCDKGWAPPTCAKAGYGGSADSGPTYDENDTSLRDGLLIFFLLVAPLTILAVYVFVNRNELKRRFHQRQRSQRHKSESSAGPSGASNNSAKEGVGPTRTAVPTYVARPSHLSPSRPAPPRPVPSRPVHPPQRV